MKKIFLIALIAITVSMMSCKKDTKLNVANVAIITEVVHVTTSTAEISMIYSYPSKLEFLLYVCENSNFDNPIKMTPTIVGDALYFQLDSLASDTYYNYRFEYSDGLSWKKSDINTFKTDKIPVIPKFEIFTSDVTCITANSATSGGIIDCDSSYEVLSRGICYSLTPNPDINCLKTNDGTGAGTFVSNLVGLDSDTKYYIRAYAISDSIYYGDELTFTTDSEIPPQSQIYFSVSDETSVVFSDGNIQFNKINDTWRFAENQYDIVGIDNNNIASSFYVGWIDLFGWGTSGYADSYPWMYTTDGSMYGFGANDIAGTNYDWGVYIELTETPHMWRTLTRDEWDYLFNVRPNADALISLAVVNDVKGIILLPDEWIKPGNLSFVPDVNNYETNSYNTIEWQILEDSGAVFLPIAGRRYGTSLLSDITPSGYYWTSSHGNRNEAYNVKFISGGVSLESASRAYGNAVRLVKDFEKIQKE